MDEYETRQFFEAMKKPLCDRLISMTPLDSVYDVEWKSLDKNTYKIKLNKKKQNEH